MNLPDPKTLPGSWLRRTTTRRTLLRNGAYLGPLLLLGPEAASVVRAGARSIALPTPAARGAQTVPACVLTPVLTEGPYFVDEQIYRTDIRSDPTTGEVKQGVPLSLTLHYSAVGNNACTPLAGAVVDIWQCDALGRYSDVQDPHFNTKGQKFLRGTQHTDENGTVNFVTIYPGWYSGRTVHIHMKVRTDPGSTTGYESNTQLFFDDALSDAVFTLQPYASKGPRDTRNADDNIFQQSDGATLLDIQLAPDGQSYMATISIGVDLSAPPQPASPIVPARPGSAG